jgi:Common central domain of tyrosinase/Polyphenol oxidase middle domain
MINNPIGRRTFIDSAVALTVVATASKPLARARGIGDEDPCRIRIRKSVASLAEDAPEITALKKAIAVMQSRTTEGDVTSWKFQTSIHGAAALPGYPTEAIWGSCQHHHYWFLPWHRMYLYFFERIARVASGDDNFALPYWNYSDATQTALPAAFTDSTDPTNVLYTANRNNAATIGHDPASPAGLSALTESVFAGGPTSYGFGGGTVGGPEHNGSLEGRLESKPHDSMHGAIGGFGGWMSNFVQAPLDPLFWVHHANIDRLWKRWLGQGGGRANPIANQWLDMPFAFYDETAQLIQMTARDVLRTEELGYRYDDDTFNISDVLRQIRCRPHIPITYPRLTELQKALRDRFHTLHPEPEPHPYAVLGQTMDIVLGPRPVATRIAGSRRALEDFNRPVQRGEKKRAFALRFDGLVAEVPVGGYYEVYLGVRAADARGQGAEFAGLLSFFGFDRESLGGKSGGTFLLPIDAALANIARSKTPPVDLTVTFVPRLGMATSARDRAIPSSVARIHELRIEEW